MLMAVNSNSPLLYLALTDGLRRPPPPRARGRGRGTESQGGGGGVGVDSRTIFVSSRKWPAEVISHLPSPKEPCILPAQEQSS